MDTVDARIPMMGEQPQFLTGAQAESNAQSVQQQIQNTRLNQMRVQAGEQQLRTQMFLSQTASQPGAIDPKTGLWSQDALDKIVKVNPELGASIIQKQTKDRLTIEQMAMDQSKTAVENRKLWTDSINDEQEKALAIADQAPPGQRDQVYQKEWAAGRDRLKKSGHFPDDVQFQDMTYGAAKETMALHQKGGKENLLEQVGNAEDTLGQWKEQLSHMPQNSPEYKQQLRKIQEGEQAISRMKAPTATQINLGGDKVPSGYEKDPEKPGSLRPIAGGPADKDKRDVLQADALSAYRARYPMGYMPEIYKNQPTPEEYTADYIKNKGQGGKGMPQKDDTATRFQSDPTMKGMTLGKKTAQGYEVMKDGKLIGHFN